METKSQAQTKELAVVMCCIGYRENAAYQEVVLRPESINSEGGKMGCWSCEEGASVRGGATVVGSEAVTDV